MKALSMDVGYEAEGKRGFRLTIANCCGMSSDPLEGKRDMGEGGR